ncbi:hypothetical protein BYT27DRAFT_7150876 [Phlegmacium glaucopus]|nr:hypothetical protein BYT27DRAFT_7150876 [Phlegmacium glaucopus]
MTTTPPTALTPLEQVQSLKSTPWTAGSASHEHHRTQNTQAHYKPFLAADIANAAIVSFDEFLQFAFSIESNWRENEKYTAFHTIVSSEKFETLLSKYQDKVNYETERYDPFNSLANYIATELNKYFPSEIIVICRNDHVPVEGSFAQRIPDCVAVHMSAMLQGERTGWDNLSKDGPKTNPFHWFELLAFLEFKLEKRDLRSAPPASSTSAPADLKGLKKKKSKALPSGDLSSKGPRGTPSNSGPSSSLSNVSLLAPSFVPSLPNSTSTGGKSSSSQKRQQEDLSLDSPRKRRRNDEEVPLSRTDTLLQCASYALEMLSHGGLRSHVFGALITDSDLELLYYDRSIPVQSKPVCFLKDPIALVVFLYGLLILKSHEWGYVRAIEPSLAKASPLPRASTRTRGNTETSPPTHNSLKPLLGAQLLLNNDKVLELGELVFHQHALIGRGTCVIRAKVKDANDPWASKSIIVKFSFTPDTRTPEGEILSRIASLANSHDNHKWVLNHLPEVLHYEALPVTELQTRLSSCLRNRDVSYENRVLQVLVMTELFNITQITTTATLAPVFRDVFRCYRWLYEEAKVIHRDVSLNNIMYRQKDDYLYGVLSDYDLSLSLLRQNPGPTSNQRTGTKPYMAIDLLHPTPPTHLYRHDLESLFYVIVVLTSRYHKGREIENPPLQEWFDLGADALGKEKKAFLTDPAPQPTADFQRVMIWTSQMRLMFRDGLQARADHDETMVVKSLGKQANSVFDESTLGGHVDFDNFGCILDTQIEN